MNEQKNNGRGIFYGVIGVATLVVAIIGATFAYFTATASNNTAIKGNMATINFGLSVTKVTDVDETKGGMIPMSNNMVEAAVTDSSVVVDKNGGEEGLGEGGFQGAGQTCVDDNGNAVCQIYKVVVTNTGSASLFLDGYITLTGGSGTPTDVGAKGANLSPAPTNSTTMRWAQVFCTSDGAGCTTAGATTTGASGVSAFTSLASASDTEANKHNAPNIKTAYADVTGTGTVKGNDYDIINRNYIRISDHTAGATYDRNADVTSALVFNQYLDAASGSLTTDEVTYYIVVWLSETGTNQTAGSDGDGAFANKDGLNFFSGNVTFNSAQGSEVTATFSGYTAVRSDKAAQAS